GDADMSDTTQQASWHASSSETVGQQLASDSSGLSSEEAARRLERYGPNRLAPPRRRGPLLRFALQVHNLLTHVMPAWMPPGRCRLIAIKSPCLLVYAADSTSCFPFLILEFACLCLICSRAACPFPWSARRCSSFPIPIWCWHSARPVWSAPSPRSTPVQWRCSSSGCSASPGSWMSTTRPIPTSRQRPLRSTR